MLWGLKRAAPARRAERTSVMNNPVCMIEHMEPRLLMAAARAAGGSGYSGTLSTNPNLRQQQLICDPDEPLQGSTSVTYNASKVSLIGYEFGPGYEPFIIGLEGGIGTAANPGEGFVGVRQTIFIPGRPPIRRTFLQEVNSFLNNPAGTEVGYVQFGYALSGAPTGQIPPAEGYTVVDEGGVDGVDTHALFFKFKDGVPTDADATFKVFAAPANFVANNAADYLIVNDAAHTRIDSPNLTSATVSTLGLTTYVRGSAWTGSFLQYMAFTGGSSSFGYRVADASKDADSGVLPWVNVDTISFRFSRALTTGVGFDGAHVGLVGPDGRPLSVLSFSYQPGSLFATIRLNSALPAGQTRVNLDLDTLASVDRTVFLNVSPGDVNRSGGSVNATDLVLTRNRIGQPAIIRRSPPPPPPFPNFFPNPRFSPFLDVDGTGVINATDLVLVRNRIGVPVPGLIAIAAPFSELTIDRSSKRLDELQ